MNPSVRDLTPEQVRLVRAKGLSIETVQIGWRMAAAYGDDFKGFLNDLARRTNVKARA